MKKIKNKIIQNDYTNDITSININNNYVKNFELIFF